MNTIPKSFIAFDLETTGFAPPCKIIEIGAVKVEEGRIVDKFQTLINPKCFIPSNITGITGISNQMVLNAPCIEDTFPAFVKFIGSLPVAAHNAGFDMKFINYEAKRLGYVIENTVIDTLIIARKHFPKLENHKLGTVARHLDIQNEMEHRGLYDADVVARVLLKLL